VARAAEQRGQTDRTENERFLEGFVLPFIRGGPVRVGRPLGAPALRALEAEALLPGDAVLAVEKARQACAGALWLYPIALPWDPLAARLSVAVHNLLFLGHPDAARWTARSSRLRQVVAFTLGLLELPRPKDGAEAVARHTLLGRLLELQREDVVLDTWLMIYNFRGQSPPRSLQRFPGLRRVREQRNRVSWIADEQLGRVQLDLCGDLLRVSPLTDLLSPLRPRPDFAWAPLADYLSSAPLSRLVCQRYLEMGLPQVGPSLCTAFWQMVAARSGGAAVRRVLGLLVYLCAAGSVGAKPVSLGGGEPLEQLGTVLAVATACSLLPSVALEPAIQERLEKLAAEQQSSVGEQTINDLAAKLRAALE
jgi:hypothetical protein